MANRDQAVFCRIHHIGGQSCNQSPTNSHCNSAHQSSSSVLMNLCSLLNTNNQSLYLRHSLGLYWPLGGTPPRAPSFRPLRGGMQQQQVAGTLGDCSSPSHQNPINQSTIISQPIIHQSKFPLFHIIWAEFQTCSDAGRPVPLITFKVSCQQSINSSLCCIS